MVYLPPSFNLAEVLCLGSFNFLIQSDKICLIIGEFILFMYRLITGTPGVKLTIFLFSILFSFLLLFLSLVWIFCSHLLLCVYFLFSLDHFYWFLFRFINYFLSCVKTTDESKQGILHLCCSVFDIQYCLVILSYNGHLSVPVTLMVLHPIHLFFLNLSYPSHIEISLIILICVVSPFGSDYCFFHFRFPPTWLLTW